jgi:hypothetical protein
MRIAIPACFRFLHVWQIFFQPYTFSLYVSLVVRCISYIQQIVGSYFLIQSDSLCLLMGKLSSDWGFTFTFTVLIEQCLLISMILLLFFQIESYVNCSVFLTLFYFRICWFSELIMLAVFIAFVGSSVPLEVYSFQTSHICDFFVLFYVYFSF